MHLPIFNVVIRLLQHKLGTSFFLLQRWLIIMLLELSTGVVQLSSTLSVSSLPLPFKQISNTGEFFCLFPILIIGGFVGSMPEDFPTYLSVGLVSFGLALLNTAFSKIEGLSYSSVFTTGNIKKSVVFGTEYLYHHRQQDLKIAINYFIVVLAFTLDAISSAIIQPFFRMKTIWVAVAIIFLTDIFYYYQKVHEPN